MSNFTIPPKKEVLVVLKTIRKAAERQLSPKEKNLVMAELSQIGHAATSGEWGYKTQEIWRKYSNLIEKARKKRKY